MYYPTRAIWCFIFFLATSAAPASPIQGQRDGSSKALTRETSLSSVDGQVKSIAKFPNPLQKRFLADFGGGWTIEIDDWGFLWPIEHAAAYIGDLHTTIWRNINQEYQF